MRLASLLLTVAAAAVPAVAPCYSRGTCDCAWADQGGTGQSCWQDDGTECWCRCCCDASPGKSCLWAGANPQHCDGNNCGGNCESKKGGVTNKWCTDNCNHNPPNCPADSCSCSGVWGGNYQPPSGIAGNAGEDCDGDCDCWSTAAGVPDDWCNTNCNHDPPHCPDTECECEAGSSSDSSSVAAIIIILLLLILLAVAAFLYMKKKKAAEGGDGSGGGQKARQTSRSEPMLDKGKPAPYQVTLFVHDPGAREGKGEKTGVKVGAGPKDTMKDARTRIDEAKGSLGVLEKDLFAKGADKEKPSELGELKNTQTMEEVYKKPGEHEMFISKQKSAKGKDAGGGGDDDGKDLPYQLTVYMQDPSAHGGKGQKAGVKVGARGKDIIMEVRQRIHDAKGSLDVKKKDLLAKGAGPGNDPLKNTQTTEEIYKKPGEHDIFIAKGSK